jgi:hypothetical protein
MADGYQVGSSQENIKTYRMYPKLLVVFKDLSTSDSASNDMVQGTGGIYKIRALRGRLNYGIRRRLSTLNVHFFLNDF